MRYKLKSDPQSVPRYWQAGCLENCIANHTVSPATQVAAIPMQCATGISLFLGLGLFHFPSILYKVIDHKDIEIVKYINP